MADLSTTDFVDAGQLSNALNGAVVTITQSPAGTWNIHAPDTTSAALTTALALVSPQANAAFTSTLLVPVNKGLDTNASGALAIGATNASSVTVTPNTTITGTLTQTGVATFTALPVLPSGTASTVLHASTVASSGAIANTDTVVAGPLTLVPAVTLKAGSKIRVTMNGTCTSSNADVGIFSFRAGTAGTTADTAFATANFTSAGSGSGIAFHLVTDITVQTLGSSGTAFGSASLLNTGTTGISTTAAKVIPFTSSTLATTTATKLSVSYISGASTTAVTFQDVSVEVIP